MASKHGIASYLASSTAPGVHRVPSRPMAEQSLLPTLCFRGGTFQSQSLSQVSPTRGRHGVHPPARLYSWQTNYCISLSYWLFHQLSFADSCCSLRARLHRLGWSICVLCRPVERMERACLGGTAAVTLLRLVTLDHVVLPPAEVMEEVRELAPQAAPSELSSAVCFTLQSSHILMTRPTLVGSSVWTMVCFHRLRMAWGKVRTRMRAFLCRWHLEAAPQ